jgi:hypothetical protein
MNAFPVRQVVLALAMAGSVAFVQAPLTIAIDIKPGDSPTSIEPGRQGVIPVAVLSSARFDATTIDTDTIRLGPTGTEASIVRANRDDVDRDKRTDLMLLFRVAEMKLRCGDTTIRLKARTTGGRDVEGSETVTLEGCP